MRKRTLIKSIALALSISLLGPLAAKANATTAPASTPNIIGESAVVMDMDTGEVIYSKNADVKRAPASTTKLMTSLLFAENKQKSDVIEFTQNSVKVVETSLIGFKPNLKPGDKISATDLMDAVMIFSANDAAYTMAEAVGGSVDNFVNMMNEKAKALGLENTNFVNPCGLEIDPLNPANKEINQTTAYDLAVIGMEAYKNAWVHESMNKTGPVTINAGGDNIIIESRSKVLGKNGNVGGKTGNEDISGHCFVGFYEKDGRKLVTTVLKSEYGADGMNVFHDTEEIANYGAKATKVPYKKSGEEVGTVELEYKLFRFFGPTKTITSPIVLAQDVEYYKNDFNDKYTQIQYTGENNAWSLTGNKEITLNLTTLNNTQDVKGTVKVSTGELLKANLGVYIAVLVFAIIVVVLIVFIVKIIGMKNTRNRRRRY